MKFLRNVVFRSVRLWWDNWFIMVSASLLWLGACLTIVFGPPVTFGLFLLVLEIQEDDYPSLKTVFSGAKQYFLKSWLWFFGTLLIMVILYSNYVFYGTIAAGWAYYIQMFSLGLGIIWIGIQFFTIPYLLAQTSKSLLLAWRNGLFTLLAAPFYAFGLWIIFGALAFFHLTIAPFIFGGPGLMMFLASRAVEERIETYLVRTRGDEPDSETVDDDETNQIENQVINWE